VLPAVAVAQADRRSLDACHSPGSDDSKLQGCERLIASGRVRGAELARAYNQRGVIFSYQKRYDAAVAELDAAIKHNPNDGVFFFNRGHARFNLRDYDGAIADTTEAIRLNYKKGVVYQWRGLAYSWKKEHDRAIVEFSQAIAIDPKLAEAYWNRGTSYMHKNDYDRAIKDLTEAIRLKPDGAGPYYRDRGVAFEYKGETDKSLADLRKALSLIPQDAATVAAAARVEQAVATKACSSTGAGSDEDKLQRCERVITSGTVTGSALARAYNERAMIYIGRKQHDAAIGELTEAIRHQPTEPSYHHSRGFALLGKSDYDRAIPDFTEALRLDPKRAQSYYWRANALYAKRQYNAVIADTTQALALTPNPTIYNFRGLAYIWKGEHDRAIAEFTEAIKLKSDDPNFFSNRGFTLFQKGDHDRAIDDFNTVIKLNPAASSPARSRLGTIHSLRGQHEKALAELNEAVRLAPERALPYWYRGFAFERAGELEKALADFRKALSIELNSEEPGQRVARTELRADEEATQAVARIEQKLAARAAAAPSSPTGLTPDSAAKLVHDLLLTSCTPVPLGEHVAAGPAVPANLQAMQAIGVATVTVVRKNDDGTTLYNVALADRFDRNQLRVVNNRTCIPQFQSLIVTAVKNIAAIKGGSKGWDGLMINADYSVQRGDLSEKLRQASGASESTAYTVRLLLRQDDATKLWRPAAFDIASSGQNYSSSNVLKTLVTD